MCYKHFVVLGFCLRITYGKDITEGVNVNLHCKNNDNNPVDWWYIYKPPLEGVPHANSGRNFTFITPHTQGRFRPSQISITAVSMLQYTFAPMFKPNYVDYLAVISYEGNHTSRKDANVAFGTLMADEKGGIWIGHTVPGLPDLSEDRIIFPRAQTPTGHILVCLSLNLATVNEVMLTIRQMSPRYTRFRLPDRLKTDLPAWNLRAPEWKQKLQGMQLKDTFEFTTRNRSLPVTLVVRKPSDRGCLYKKFALKKKLVLDVYGHKTILKPLCRENFGIRIIDSISIKDSETINYIGSTRDRAEFAVSTAAHWQRAGASGLRNFWACVGTPDDAGFGGLLLCVEEYSVWISFDNLKVKEPEC